jgi:hypothetical protein
MLHCTLGKSKCRECKALLERRRYLRVKNTEAFKKQRREIELRRRYGPKREELLRKKREAMKEHYRKNAERIKAREFARYHAWKAEMNRPVDDQDVDRFLARFEAGATSVPPEPSKAQENTVPLKDEAI